MQLTFKSVKMNDGTSIFIVVMISGGSTVPGFFHTMRKQFTPIEWDAVKSQPSEWKQLQMFYRHWVRRKAES